jgi:hypothetical protein
MMKLNILLATALVAPLMTMSACATDKTPTAEEAAPLTVINANATMPFAQLRSTIRDWTEREDGSLLIRGNNDRWYHATFMGPCPWLNMANRIGFKTNPGGDLDKFSSVRVDGYECQFSTFDEVADPRPPKAT